MPRNLMQVKKACGDNEKNIAYQREHHGYDCEDSNCL